MKSLMEKDTEFCSSTSTTAAAGLFKESETVQGGCRALPSISAHCFCRLTQKYEKNFTKFVSKSDSPQTRVCHRGISTFCSLSLIHVATVRQNVVILTGKKIHILKVHGGKGMCR